MGCEIFVANKSINKWVTMKEIDFLRQYILEAPAPHSKHVEVLQALSNIINAYEAQITELKKSIENEQETE